jgi:purine-binding chemotaxis protein CheW
MKFLLFRIEEQIFGIEISTVVEIINPMKLTTLPEVPEYIVGVINLRGEAITVVDMRKRLSMQKKPSKERIIVVRMPDEKIGLLVDEVKGIEEIEDNKVRKPSRLYRGLKAKFIVGIIERSSQDVIILLNIEKIVTEQQQIALKQVKKR